MRVISLLCSLLLLVTYSSNSSSDVSIPEDAESKYSQGLPATDFGFNQPPKAEAAPVPETGYSRQFVLEEEVIASVRGKESSASLTRDHGDFKASADRASMPPLEQTFTLQLVAVKEMEQAVEYAQRYGIESAQAGVARILSKGRLWYVLVYGVYASREDANIAKSDLQSKGVPESWIRTLATLETLSREAGGNGF